MDKLISIALAAFCISAGSPSHTTTDDKFGLAQVLIRHDLATPDTYLHYNAQRFRFFISVENADLPPAVVSALKDTGLTILPGSAWKPPTNGTIPRHDMRLAIGTPTPQPDGTYIVGYNMICGSRCGSINIGTLRRDARGWHVVRTLMDGIL